MTIKFCSFDLDYFYGYIPLCRLVLSLTPSVSTNLSSATHPSCFYFQPCSCHSDTSIINKCKYNYAIHRLICLHICKCLKYVLISELMRQRPPLSRRKSTWGVASISTSVKWYYQYCDRGHELQSFMQKRSQCDWEKKRYQSSKEKPDMDCVWTIRYSISGDQNRGNE